MPLLDHCRPPFRKHCHWEGFHSFWASTIVSELNLGVLSARFRAEPRIRLGGGLEVDVGTLEKEVEPAEVPDSGNGVATAIWAPPLPSVEINAQFSDQDLFEVQLVDDDEFRLVAAIELVSPRNKDRPTSRRDFVVKCGSYLQSGVSVIVVDVVTERRANLHAELMQLLDVKETESWSSPTGLSAMAYRVLPRHPGVRKASRLQAWLNQLTVGASLPTVPLWLTEELVAPLDLEKTYALACKSMRLPS